MLNCDLCSKFVEGTEIPCDGGCARIFHAACIKSELSIALDETLQISCPFICKACAQPAPEPWVEALTQTGQGKTAAVTPLSNCDQPSLTDLLTAIERMNAALSTLAETQRSHNAGIVQSLKDCRDDVLESAAKLAVLESKVDGLAERTGALKCAHCAKARRLEKPIEMVRRDGRRESLEIRGMPANTEERTTRLSKPAVFEPGDNASAESAANGIRATIAGTDRAQSSLGLELREDAVEEEKVRRELSERDPGWSENPNHRVCVEMNPDSLGSIGIKVEPLDHDNPPDVSADDQKARDFTNFEFIEVDSHSLNPIPPPLLSMVKEESEALNQNSSPTTLLPTRGEREESMELDMKIESDDCGVWKDEPAGQNTVKIQRAESDKIFDKRQTSTEIKKKCRIGHVLLRTEERLYECSICRKVFTRKSTIKLHMLIHSGEKPHACTICGIAFRVKSNLRRHMVVHNGEKSHKCGVCKRTFAEKSALNSHKLVHTSEYPHECRACRKVFKFKSSLKEHAMIHTGEKPVDCHFCGMAFALKSSLKRHLSTHERESPYECSICGTMLTGESRARKHMLLHSREKRHECGICGKPFAQICHLKQHVMVHTGEKPHECVFCRKAFADKSSMKRHIMVHTGEKPHECPVCRKAFADKSSMNRHLSIH